MITAAAVNSSLKFYPLLFAYKTSSFLKLASQSARPDIHSCTGNFTRGKTTYCAFSRIICITYHT